MALTNYCIYKWLIFLLEKETDEQHGMTLKDISQRYLWDKDKIFGYDPRTSRTRFGLPERKVELVDAEGKKHTEYLPPEITCKTFLNWRHAIYKQFGLLIQQTIFKNIVQNRYYLVNPELLDENRTLRATIEDLVNEEQRGYEAKTLLTVSPRGRKPKAEGVGGTMGFVSVGGDNIDYHSLQYGHLEEPEMVGMIQFAMTIGEALVISKRAYKFVFEPQQLKCINGRWYVAGDQYEYGNRETYKVVVYDVKKIKLCEEVDIITPAYTIKDGFDIYNLMPENWSDHFDPNKVVSLYLKVAGYIFEGTPFCQAQEKLNVNVGVLHDIYKVYLLPDKDFYIQYMSYGDEVRVVECPDNIHPSHTDITANQIKYLKDLRKQGLK